MAMWIMMGTFLTGSAKGIMLDPTEMLAKAMKDGSVDMTDFYEVTIIQIQKDMRKCIIRHGKGKR